MFVGNEVVFYPMSLLYQANGLLAIYVVYSATVWNSRLTASVRRYLIVCLLLNYLICSIEYVQFLQCHV